MKRITWCLYKIVEHLDGVLKSRVVVVVVVRLYLTRVTYNSNKTDKLMALSINYVFVKISVAS